MNKKGLLFSLTLVLFASSCNFTIDYGEDVSNNYENLVPYINVEKIEENKYFDINVDEYAIKMDASDTFICLFYTANCSACKAAKEKYIIPYIEETKNKVYAIDVYSDVNLNNLEKLQSYQPEDSSYVRKNEEGVMVVSRPLIQTTNEGQVIAYEKGLTKNIRYILDGYCLV